MKTICNTSGTLTVFLTFKVVLTIIFTLVPIIIMINTGINLFKAVKSGKDEDIKGSFKQSIKNIIAGLIIFLIPTIFSFVFENLVDANGDDVLACITNATIEKVEALKESERQERLAAEEEEKRRLKGEIDEKNEEENKRNEALQEQREKNKEANNNNNNGTNGNNGGNLSPPGDPNLTGNAFVQSLLSGAKEVTDYIRVNNFTYGYATVNPALDQSQGIVACDNCVGWFLYKAGYTDNQPSFYGLDRASLQTYMLNHGFTKITDVNQIQPGDVVFVNPDAGGFPGHVFLLGNSLGNGLWERYDCGSINRIRLTNQYSSYSSQPFHEYVNNFVYAYRSPKAQ